MGSSWYGLIATKMEPVNVWGGENGNSYLLSSVFTEAIAETQVVPHMQEKKLSARILNCSL